MKTENLQKVDELVAVLNAELNIDAADEENRKLEKQIRKIVKRLIKDIAAVTEKKIAREEKRLAHEVRLQQRANRILAARQILKGKVFASTTV